MMWTDYDPTWIANAVREIYPAETALLNNILQCTTCMVKNDKYTYFVDATNSNRPGSKWQFLTTMEIHKSACGPVKLDILKGNKLGGVEFLGAALKD